MLATDEVSIGDYVLSGGEPAAVVLVDAVDAAHAGRSGERDLGGQRVVLRRAARLPELHAPVEFRGRRVPEVLLGGHHAEVARWRRRAALAKTRRNRPDLFERVELSEASAPQSTKTRIEKFDRAIDERSAVALSE